MTTSVWSRLYNDNPLGQAWLFGLLVILAVPALLFSRFMPGWAPPVALLGLFVLFLLRGQASGYRFTPVDGPLLVLMMMLPVGLWVSPDLAVTLPLTYAFVANLALFWAVAAQQDAPWLRHSGWLLMLAGLGLGAALMLGVNYSTAKLPFINREIYSLLPGGWRPFWNPAGFNPNMMGGLLAIFWPPVVVLAWRGPTWQQRDSAKVVAVLLGLLLLLAQSRGALLGAIAALVTMTLVQNRRWIWGWLAVAVLAALVGYQTETTFILDQGPVSSLKSRLELWDLSARLMATYPLTGVGLGMVEPTIRQLYDTTLGGEFKHAHNIYLQSGAEMGLPGLLAYLTLFFLLFKLLLHQTRSHHQHGVGRASRVLALGLLGSLTALLVHGFFDVITFGPRPATVVWALLGLMAAVSGRSGAKRKTHETA